MSFVKEYVQKRTSKNVFFSQVHTLIDWLPIEKELRKVYISIWKKRYNNSLNNHLTYDKNYSYSS